MWYFEIRYSRFKIFIKLAEKNKPNFILNEFCTTLPSIHEKRANQTCWALGDFTHVFHRRSQSTYPRLVSSKLLRGAVRESKQHMSVGFTSVCIPTLRLLVKKTMTYKNTRHGALGFVPLPTSTCNATKWLEREPLPRQFRSILGSLSH